LIGQVNIGIQFNLDWGDGSPDDRTAVALQQAKKGRQFFDDNKLVLGLRAAGVERGYGT
jgi:hypothetical protein